MDKGIDELDDFELDDEDDFELEDDDDYDDYDDDDDDDDMRRAIGYDIITPGGFF